MISEGYAFFSVLALSLSTVIFSLIIFVGKVRFRVILITI